MASELGIPSETRLQFSAHLQTAAWVVQELSPKRHRAANRWPQSCLGSEWVKEIPDSRDKAGSQEQVSGTGVTCWWLREHVEIRKDQLIQPL